MNSLWSSFNSFFELTAALCFTYAFIEPFTASFNRKIYELDDFFKTALFLTNVQKTRTQNYFIFLEKNSWRPEIFDPLNAEIKGIVDRFRVIFFHGFLTSVLFLIMSGFENFYDGHISIDGKVCGLIIIPFISLLIFCVMPNSLKSKVEIEYELRNWKGNVIPADGYDTVIPFLLISYFVGFLSIACMDGDVSFFSPSIEKWITAFCMILILVPFLIQQYYFNETLKRYDEVAYDLI